MSFVFVPPPPSPRARRLARDLTATIDEFRRQNPGTSATEIHQALNLAGTGTGVQRRLLVAALLGFLLLGLGIAFFFARSPGEEALPIIPVVIGLLVAVALLAVKFRS